MTFPVRLGLRFAHTARAIVYSSYGAPAEALSVLRHRVADPVDDQVLLRLVATPINPADLNQIEGVYPSKPRFSKDLGTSEEVAVGGNEGVFEVIQAGEKAQSFKAGDWVIPRIASFGTWTTHKLAQAGELIRLGAPRGLTPVQAATVAVNPSTAYRMLSDFGNLESNDWFIQNGGNSSVGRMAIQLGKIWGYKSISVVRDRRDIELLKQELHELGADHVVTEEQISDKSIRHVIKDWTHGQPVKLALNCVGGRSATNVARQLGDGGVLVTYGGMSKQPVSLSTSLLVFKDIESHGFWMTRWAKQHPVEREEMIQDLLRMLRTGEIQTSNILSTPLDLEADDKTFFAAFSTALSKGGKHVLVAGGSQAEASAA